MKEKGGLVLGCEHLIYYTTQPNLNLNIVVRARQAWRISIVRSLNSTDYYWLAILLYLMLLG